MRNKKLKNYLQRHSPTARSIQAQYWSYEFDDGEDFLRGKKGDFLPDFIEDDD